MIKRIRRLFCRHGQVRCSITVLPSIHVQAHVHTCRACDTMVFTKITNIDPSFYGLVPPMGLAAEEQSRYLQ
jgi:hypothetical protein